MKQAFGVEKAIMPNNQKFLCRVIKQCRSFGIDPIVFGGWAEEYQGKDPWAHADIDFIICAKDLSDVDLMISSTKEWREIHLKRFPHKRAAMVDGTMIEFCLIKKEANRLVTDFFNQVKFVWPEGKLWEEVHWLGLHVKVTNKNVLDFYRQNHAGVRRAYKDYCSEQAASQGPRGPRGL